MIDWHPVRAFLDPAHIELGQGASDFGARELAGLAHQDDDRAIKVLQALERHPLVGEQALEIVQRPGPPIDRLVGFGHGGD